MSKLRLTLACGDYDRVAPLKEGRVQPEGIDLNFIPLEPEELFFRMARYQDFDAAEMSLASYIIHRAQGKKMYQAIPVFPSRMFRHSAIYVNAGAGIEKPQDLRGRRVGVPEYQMTAVVWVKGILSEFYDVPPTEVHWLTGGQEEPGRKERMPLSLPPEFRVEPIGNDRTLSEMLESGELDALIAARTPSPFLRGSCKVRRLFADPVREEQEYFRRTGIFPIMHTVVIRSDILESAPWVALSLYKAFERARRVALQGVAGAPALRYSLAWLQHYWAEEERLLGPDAWAYGLAKNRRVVETLSRYLLEQGLIEEIVPVDELFFPTTHEEAKI